MITRPTRKALLISGQESDTASTLARNLIHVGGLSLFARQMKQMKAIGIEEMHVITDWFIHDFETEILKCSDGPNKILLHNSKDAPFRLLDHNTKGDIWFILEEGVLLDDRIIDHVADHPATTVISFIGRNEFLSSYTDLAISLQLDKYNGYFGSIAKLSSAVFATHIRKFNRPEGLQNALKSISRTDNCKILPVTEIPLYLASHQRDVDLLWVPLRRHEEGNRATDILLDFFQQDIPDWTARYISQPIENFIVKYLCKCPLGSRPVIIVAGLLAMYVFMLFWKGHLTAALAGAYSITILYGLGNKLAQLKITTPEFKIKLWRLVGFLKNITEYSWYIAIALYLSNLHGSAPVIIAISLILFRLADEIQIVFFHRMTGHHIGTMTDFDRKFHLITGGRNILMWTLLPFIIFNLYYIGFGFIAIYGIMIFFIHQIRLIYHFKNSGMTNSVTFTENFKKNKIL